MEHVLDTGAFAVIAVCVVLWGLVSSRLERVNVGGSITSVVFGVAAAHEPLVFIDVRHAPAPQTHRPEPLTIPELGTRSIAGDRARWPRTTRHAK